MSSFTVYPLGFFDFWGEWLVWLPLLSKELLPYYEDVNTNVKEAPYLQISSQVLQSPWGCHRWNTLHTSRL